MWTQKSVTISRKSVEQLQQLGQPIGLALQMYVELVFTDGTNDIEVATFISEPEHVVQAVKDHLDRLNKQETFISEVNTAGSVTIPPTPEPVPPTAKEIAQREYDEALALYQDLKTKAELDPTTFNWGLDNQRVIVQQKLQSLMAAI
jgi:hypothetical protein